MTVNRWHSNPSYKLRNSGDTIDAHQRRVMNLCEEISGWRCTRPSLDLLLAALNHDAAEAIIGDMPSPAKKRFPKLGKEYEKAEKEVLASMGLIYDLSDIERAILKLADRLDAYLWVKKHDQEQLETPEWIKAAKKIKLSAETLGIAARVEEMIV